jgi:hypothetical protein
VSYKEEKHKILLVYLLFLRQVSDLGSVMNISGVFTPEKKILLIP